MVATAASSSINAPSPSIRHPHAAFSLSTPSTLLHYQHPEIPPIDRGRYRTETSPTASIKRRVHFAATPQTLYFLSSRPTNVTVEPLAELVIKPLNCSYLGQGRWLASISQMREEPFCQLDYLRVGTEAEHHSSDMLWPLEDDNDPISSCTSVSTCRVSAISEFFLVGEVAAYNLDYKKEVIIHYTMDEWKSKATVRARYTSSIAVLRIDKFKFTIPVPSPCPNNLEVAVEYQVCSRSYWDSLNGLNYRFGLSLAPLLLHTTDSLSSITDEEGIDQPFARHGEASIASTPTRDLTSFTALAMPIAIEKARKHNVSLLSSSPAHIAVWSGTSGPFSLSRIPKTSLLVPASSVKEESKSQISSSWDCTKSFTLMTARASRDGLHPGKHFPQAELLNNPSLAMPFF